MTQSKHTPAPWIISENNNKEKIVLQEFRTTPSGRDVQEKVCTIKNQLDWKERDANAHLIASAPELLEALEGLELECLADRLNPCWDGRPNDIAGQHWGSEPDNFIPACASCKAKAAIAKAKGEAQ